MSLRKWSTIGVVLAVVGVVGALAVPSLRWRLQVLALHASGGIPDVDWSDVITFVKPGSGGYDNLQRLLETRNPYPVLRNPHTSGKDVSAGAEMYASRCIACHGADGAGGAAPALVGRELRNGESDWAIYRVIRFGVPGTGMQAHALPTDDVWRLVGYVRSLNSKHVFPQPKLATTDVAVPYEAIETARLPAEDWLTFSGSYSSHRHSVLTQIDPSNVGQLTIRWIHQFKGSPPKVEATPLVRNGVMFTTVPNGRVLALDATTGKQLWAFEREPPSGAAGGEFGMLLNRGVALLDDKVFVGTGDARLIALSAASGKVLWDVPVAEPDQYYISAAPLAYRDLIVTGAGTKGGGRGFVAAFEAASGKERWRFVTIPGPGEFGNDTWGGESWREGGAPTWMTGSYDPIDDVLYWGAGNPKPDYDLAVRPGDNLYSNSALALRGMTGELLWHFQFTPADDKDWDSNQIPILANLPAEQGTAPRMLWANRNGFYYVLERKSGRYLTSRPFVQQNWTAGIDERGRPLPPTGLERKREGFVIYPGNVGGTNWWPPSYDAERGLFFLPVIEQGMVFFPTERSYPRGTGKSFYTAIRALRPDSGQIVWEYKRPPRFEDPEIGGLLSTRTGLLFGADESTFFALDAATGRMLWSTELGGKIGAAPMTYAVNEEQFIVIASGRDLVALGLPNEAPAPDVTVAKALP